MDELRSYTVIPYLGLHDAGQEQPAHVVTGAMSPQEAAELVLGERLVPFGHTRDLRATVAFEGIGGQKTLLLYRHPKQPD